MSQNLYMWLCEEMNSLPEPLDGSLPDPIEEIPGGDLVEWILDPEEPTASSAVLQPQSGK